MNTLDKEEFRIKLEEINKLVQKKDYKGAMGIVDSIDWRRVKNVRTLCVVGEIYAANGRYEDSKEIFLLAYHKASIGKNILYRLIEISLKMKDINEAEEFFDEYRQVASNDTTQYILQYKIAKAKDISINEQIRILEEYKEQEFTEKWSYELATLYYKAGEKQKCLDLCNEIILWFNEGKYVMKAYDLKLRMGELTGEEKAKYEKQFVPRLITPEEAKNMNLKKPEEEKDTDKQSEDSAEEKAAASSVSSGQEIESIPVTEESLSDMESIQDKISKGIRDIFGGGKKKEEDSMDSVMDGESQDLVKENISEDIPGDIPEEIIKSDVSEQEPENVPELEAEPAKPGESPVVKEEEIKEEQKPQMDPADFSKTMKLPELKIPKSMKNMEMSSAPKVPDLSKTDFSQMASGEFNLEDSILAAATAQGIEIPDEKPEEVKEEVTAEKQEEVQESEKAPETNEEPEKTEPELEEPDFLNMDISDEESEELTDVTKMPDFLFDDEEETLTEEDLQSAEAEFLRGPEKKEEPAVQESQEPEETQEDDSLVIPEIPDEEELTEEEELERFIESLTPENEKDPLNIVPREKALTDEEKQLFTYFVKVPGMKEQLIDTLCDVQMAAADRTSKTGNIIVMGGRECGKPRLISGLIPAICKELNLEASKVAYVFADQINGKNIYKIFSKLAGGFLVIENANQLTPETVEMLDKAMEANTDGLTVIVEDEKIGMRKFMARFPKLAQKFTSMINIPVFTNDELVNFARVYTKENGYAIDQMGMLALYNLIGINQKEDQPMNVGAVKDLIDAAIVKSQGGIRKFQRNISKKRTDKDGYIVLYEKDFSK